MEKKYIVEFIINGNLQRVKNNSLKEAEELALAAYKDNCVDVRVIIIYLNKDQIK